MDAAALNARRLLAYAIPATFKFLVIADALYFEAEFGDELVNDHRLLLDCALEDGAVLSESLNHARAYLRLGLAGFYETLKRPYVCCIVIN